MVDNTMPMQHNMGVTSLGPLLDLRRWRVAGFFTPFPVPLPSGDLALAETTRWRQVLYGFRNVPRIPIYPGALLQSIRRLEARPPADFFDR